MELVKFLALFKVFIILDLVRDKEEWCSSVANQLNCLRFNINHVCERSCSGCKSKKGKNAKL